MISADEILQNEIAFGTFAGKQSGNIPINSIPFVAVLTNKPVTPPPNTNVATPKELTITNSQVSQVSHDNTSPATHVQDRITFIGKATGINTNLSPDQTIQLNPSVGAGVQFGLNGQPAGVNRELLNTYRQDSPLSYSANSQVAGPQKSIGNEGKILGFDNNSGIWIIVLFAIAFFFLKGIFK